MNIKIAIQKSGRLYEGSVGLLKECGIDLANGANQLRCEATNFPIEVLFLRDDDIPQYVEDAVADLGIAGENIVLEKEKSVTRIMPLGFGKCRLSMAVPRAENYTGSQWLQNRRIATSYPVIVQKFLNDNQINAEIHEISGSVEIAPGIGLADAVCDLVSSGSTLFLNGLKETETILRSEALLFSNNNLSPEKKEILNRLILRINAVKKARHNKYIMLNAPNHKLEQICSLIPGMKSPSILPLASEGWSAVQSVLHEDDFWEIIEQLQAAGAEGILVLPIEKMIV